MLRIVQSISQAAAKSYYVQGLSREDYYSQEQEIIGNWGGKAAAMLGLYGQVEQAGFDALCDNINPATGGRLTPYNKSARRVGYDFNFHCPKSVSAVYALTGDESILHAFRDAVRETMQELETAMATRVRQAGRNEDRLTGNLIWAEFVHFTARPVGGFPDPHLHAHCFTFNATFDAQEKRFKAGQFGEIKREAGYYEACFHAKLAGKLRTLGYGIERTAKGWEVAGVPQSVIDKFSRRTKQIERVAQEKGIADAKAKDQLGARTREHKQKDVSRAQLEGKWANRLTDDEKRALRQIKARSGAEKMTARQAMDYALGHAFERASVIGEKKLLAAALRYGVGSVTVEGVKAECARADILKRELDGRQLTTTRAVLSEEKAMIDFARAGRGQCAPLGPAAYQVKREFLTDEQKASMRSVLSSPDRVIGLRGAAGTGKTTVIQEIISGIEENGRKVYVFAPSAQASRGVLRGEGFKEADTVASLLKNKALQAKLKGQVVLIDEAGLVGSKTLKSVFDVAKEQNARVILSGDVRQHASVERGDALRVLEDNAGLRSAFISKIQRQRGSYKEAVTDLSKGNLESGFDKLDAIGAIVEIDSQERHSQLAKDYLQAVNAGKSALVISPTHQEGEKVAALIRGELRHNKRIGADDRAFTQQRNLAWTEAERSNASNYQEGLVVQFHQHAKGFKRGEKVTVSGRDDSGKVWAAKPSGERVALPLDQANRFQVYEAKTLLLSRGDKLRITQNGFTLEGKHRLENGSMYQVKGFTGKGDIQLMNGWAVSKDFGNFAHGYSVTSHVSQGMTVDRVFIAQGRESAAASSREQFYVSVSRGREFVKIYTDDKQGLKESVGYSSVRVSAVELMQRGKKPSTVGRLDFKKQAERVNRLAAQTRAIARKTASFAKNLIDKYSRSVSYSDRVQQREKGMDYER